MPLAQFKFQPFLFWEKNIYISEGYHTSHRNEGATAALRAFWWWGIDWWWLNAQRHIHNTRGGESHGRDNPVLWTSQSGDNNIYDHYKNNSEKWILPICIFSVLCILTKIYPPSSLMYNVFTCSSGTEPLQKNTNIRPAVLVTKSGTSSNKCSVQLNSVCHLWISENSS